MKNSFIFRTKKQGGYITLILVLAVSAVATLLALTLFDRNIRTLQSAVESQDSLQARIYAQSCLDYALDSIAIDRPVPCPPSTPSCSVSTSNLQMQGDLQFSHGSCSYSISGADPRFSITTYGNSGKVQAGILAETSITVPKISISSYQEI